MHFSSHCLTDISARTMCGREEGAQIWAPTTTTTTTTDSPQQLTDKTTTISHGTSLEFSRRDSLLDGQDYLCFALVSPEKGEELFLIKAFIVDMEIEIV